MRKNDRIPNRWEWLLIASFYLLVSLYATYPLINHFTQAIPYVFLPESQAELLPLVSGDHLQTYYWFWLFKDNVLGASPLFSNPYEFNIGGTHIQHGYAQFPVSILFLILSVFGNVPAHNLLILLTYIFSGMALHYLLRLWGISLFPALVGGLIFCLAPSRQTQLLSGHINGYVWFLIPLTLYWFEKGFQAKRYGYIVLSGFCILVLGLAETHLLYFFLLFLGLYLPARILGPWLVDQETERLPEDSCRTFLVPVAGPGNRDPGGSRHLPGPRTLSPGKDPGAHRRFHTRILRPLVLYLLDDQQPDYFYPDRSASS